MLRVVVNMSVGIADDRLRAPHIRIVAAGAISPEARSIRLGNTAHGHRQLGGVVGKQQIATSLDKSLQRFDGLCA